MSTKFVIPSDYKWATKVGVASCLKPTPQLEGITQVSTADCRLRAPVLWYDGADMVFHYSLGPWKVIDAVASGNKDAIRSVNKPELHGQLHTEHEFTNSELF